MRSHADCPVLPAAAGGVLVGRRVWSYGTNHARSMMAMLWIGFAGTVYQASAPGLPASRRVSWTSRGSRISDGRWRCGARSIDRPACPEDFGYSVQYWATERTSSTTRRCMQAGDRWRTRFRSARRRSAEMRPRVPGSRPAWRDCLHRSRDRALPEDGARIECGRLGASDLVATRWDGVGSIRRGWVWRLPRWWIRATFGS